MQIVTKTHQDSQLNFNQDMLQASLDMSSSVGEVELMSMKTVWALKTNLEARGEALNILI